MAALTVVSSEPLPPLTVVSSEPLPAAGESGRSSFFEPANPALKPAGHFFKSFYDDAVTPFVDEVMDTIHRGDVGAGTVGKLLGAFKDQLWNFQQHPDIRNLPIVGPGATATANRMQEQYNKGDYAGALGSAAGFVAPLVAPEAAAAAWEKLPAAAKSAASAVSNRTQGALETFMAASDPRRLLKLVPKGQAAVDAFDAVQAERAAMRAARTPAPPPNVIRRISGMGRYPAIGRRGARLLPHTGAGAAVRASTPQSCARRSPAPARRRGARGSRVGRYSALAGSAERFRADTRGSYAVGPSTRQSCACRGGARRGSRSGGSSRSESRRDRRTPGRANRFNRARRYRTRARRGRARNRPRGATARLDRAGERAAGRDARADAGPDPRGPHRSAPCVPAASGRGHRMGQPGPQSRPRSRST